MHKTAKQEFLKRLDRNGYGASEPPTFKSVASDDSPLLLTIEEVAELINLSVRTIHRLVSAKEMPLPIRVRGCKRFRRNEIVAWVAAGCPKPE